MTHLPLRELWRDDGFSTTTRGKSLTEEDVREFLTSGPVQFVVVDVGAAPRWIPEKLSFSYTAWALGNPRVLTDERG